MSTSSKRFELAARDTPPLEVREEPLDELRGTLSMALHTTVGLGARSAPPKPKPELDVSQIRALLNKTPDTPAEAELVAKEDVASENIRLTLNEIDAFRTQMRRCWNPPSGARNAEDLIVQVRVSLAPNGMISAGPKVMNRAQLGDPFFRAAAESVLRAIRRCQPFEMPPEKYAAWRDIELKFDPGKMLGGQEERLFHEYS